MGQDTVIRTLRNAIRNERLAHAFLFSGVRGVGKTTTARLLAKALNCVEGPTEEPCRECESCREIADANSVDVLEIDAASQSKVDQMRDLLSHVAYGTSRDRFKIFIIDEVHMLSSHAFNALLKTLEEPPPHVKFILATTEHHKIPVTITSRCQQYDFKPIPFPLILERLRLICDEENVDISDRALHMISATAEGSMRDAQSALDQIIAFAGKEVSDEDVRALLGVVDSALALDLLAAVAERERESLIRQLQDAAEEGIAPVNLCRRLIEQVRTLMVFKLTGWDDSLLQVAESDRDAIEALSKQFSEVDLIRYYDILSATETELKWHPNPAVHLEISILKLIELAHLPALEEFLAGGGKSPPASPSGSGEKPASAQRSSRPARTTEKEEKVSAEKPGAPAQQGNGKSTDPLHLILKLIQDKHLSIQQFLDAAKTIELVDGELRIGYGPDEELQAGMLKDPDRMEKLREACSTVLGEAPKVVVRIAEPQSNQPKAEIDPMDDPRVKMFYERFPGKVIVKKKQD